MIPKFIRILSHSLNSSKLGKIALHMKKLKLNVDVEMTKMALNPRVSRENLVV